MNDQNGILAFFLRKLLNMFSIICSEDLVKHMENVNAKKAENRRILQERLVTLQKQVSNQKIKLSASIFILKKKELQKNNICICRGFCRIHHDKHNYTNLKVMNC